MLEDLDSRVHLRKTQDDHRVEFQCTLSLDVFLEISFHLIQ